MNHLTQPREWPTLKLSRWQIIQLSVLSVLIAAMAFWKFQYEQVLPKSSPVQMVLPTQGSSMNDQSLAKTTPSLSPASVVKSRF
ncbi:hypothetical protein ACFPMF_21180 [Larkinella bovis]|uniref:Energy transducer TonB n=1 Tax=Larkinella bovis TaxID=683041 RepID=A0ABW0IEE0_9BACT